MPSICISCSFWYSSSCFFLLSSSCFEVLGSGGMGMCTRSGMTGTGVLFFVPTVKKSSSGTGSSFGSAGPRTLAGADCCLDPSNRFCIVDLGMGLVSTFQGGSVEAGLMPDLPVSLMGIFPLVSASPSFFPSPSFLALSLIHI